MLWVMCLRSWMHTDKIYVSFIVSCVHWVVFYHCMSTMSPIVLEIQSPVDI